MEGKFREVWTVWYYFAGIQIEHQVGLNTPIKVEVCEIVGWVFFDSWLSAVAPIFSLLVCLNVETTSVCSGAHCGLWICWHLTPSFLQPLCLSPVWLKWGRKLFGDEIGFHAAKLCWWWYHHHYSGERISSICVHPYSLCPLKAHLKCSEGMSAYHICKCWCNKHDAVSVQELS